LNKLITIITVTYNCAGHISTTLKSILTNKPPTLEYIIVDGASTDGTLEKIHPFKDKIDLLVSESDSGIYDAMNKGLKAASGDYILFINAGDTIYDPQVLPSLLANIKASRADIYYGDAMLIDSEGRELGLRSIESSRALPDSLNWKSLERGMVVCHQSFIVKRSLAGTYDLRYRSSADIDWMITSLKKATNIIHTGMVISGYLVGGFSKQTHQTSLRERFAILAHHYGMPRTLLNHFIILLRSGAFKLKGKNLN